MRYSAVRRQGAGAAPREEPAVLDYPTQLRRLLPLVAAAYAFHYTGDIVRRSPCAPLRPAPPRAPFRPLPLATSFVQGGAGGAGAG